MKQLPVDAGTSLIYRPRNTRVKAVIEPDLDSSTRLRGYASNSIYLRSANTGRLFHEHMRSGLQRRNRKLGELAVDCGHNDHVQLLGKEVLQADTGLAAIFGGQSVAPFVNNVEASHKSVATDGLRALVPNEATANYSDAQWRLIERSHENSLAEAPPYSKSKVSSWAPSSFIARRVSSGWGV